jgi:hypothetical protein
MNTTHTEKDVITTAQVKPESQPQDEGYDVYAQRHLDKFERTDEEVEAWEVCSKRVARKFDHYLLAMMCFQVGECGIQTRTVSHWLAPSRNVDTVIADI